MSHLSTGPTCISCGSTMRRLPRVFVVRHLPGGGLAREPRWICDSLPCRNRTAAFREPMNVA